MRRPVIPALAAMLLTLAAPVVATTGPKGGAPGTSAMVASGFGWNGAVVCGGNTFSTCAAVNVTTLYDAATRTTFVTLRVTNLSGTNGTYGGTVFTQMGLFNLPKGTSYAQTGFSAFDANGHAIGGWQTGSNGLSGAGIGKEVRGVDPTQGINGGLQAGSTYVFTFALTGFKGAPDLSSIGFALHGQAGPNGCSTKLVVTNGVANQGSPGTCIATPPPPTVTPEPLSMTLMATGLAGLGAVHRRRKLRPTA